MSIYYIYILLIALIPVCPGIALIFNCIVNCIDTGMPIRVRDWYCNFCTICKTHTRQFFAVAIYINLPGVFRANLCVCVCMCVCVCVCVCVYIYMCVCVLYTHTHTPGLHFEWK